MTSTQVKFSDNMDWWNARPQPRADMETIPFVGSVAGVTPVARIEKEVRRRDVGQQTYGSGTPTQMGAHVDRHGLLKPPKLQSFVTVDTSHGKLNLTSNEQDLGFMPTAAAVNFLRHEYLGSRFAPKPARYYPI
jgi:hypothetical protein